MNSTQAAAQVVDLRPLFDIAVTLVVTVLGAVGTWIGNWFVKKLQAEKGLLDEKQAESLRALVEQVVQGGIGYADELARQYGRDRATIQVRNEMAVVALRYAVAAAPQALGALGVSQEGLHRMILSRMPTPQGDIPQDALTPMRLPAAPAGSLAAVPAQPIPAAPIVPPQAPPPPAGFNPYAGGMPI